MSRSTTKSIKKSSSSSSSLRRKGATVTSGLAKKRNRAVVETPSPAQEPSINVKNTKQLKSIAKQEIRQGRKSMTEDLKTALGAEGQEIETAFTDVDNKADSNIRTSEQNTTLLSADVRSQVSRTCVPFSRTRRIFYLHSCVLNTPRAVQ